MAKAEKEKKVEEPKEIEEEEKSLEIQIVEPDAKLLHFDINLEKAKSFILYTVEKFKGLAVTEESLQIAKKSRTELNKMKKDLNGRMIAVKKTYMKPFEELKLKTDELDKIIEEPLKEIDEKIKEIEEGLKSKKREDICQFYLDEYGKREFTDSIQISSCWQDEWLNTSCTKKKYETAIIEFLDRAKSDLEIIETFDDDFKIPLKDLYLETFSMSDVMRKKIDYDKKRAERIKDELEKAEKLKAEEVKKPTFVEEKGTYCQVGDSIVISHSKEEIPEEIIQDETFDRNLTKEELINTPESDEDYEQTIKSILSKVDIPNEDESIPDEPPVSSPEIIEDEIPEQTLEPKEELIYLEVWYKLTPEQKLAMRDFVITNKIQCGAIKR